MLSERCLEIPEPVQELRLQDVDRGWSGGRRMGHDFRTLKIKPLEFVSRETPTAM